MAGLHQVDTPHDEDKDQGTLVLVVRKDTDGDALLATADGRFAALTVTKDGYLRVDVPATGIELAEAPTVESLLEETNSLLRRLVLGLELLHGKSIPDPR